MPPQLPAAVRSTVMSILVALLEEIECSVHASVLRRTDEQTVTVTSTDPRVGSLLDGAGPTLAALAGRTRRVPTVRYTAEFPEYVDACRACGVNSVVAVPIKAGRDTIGVVTVTSADHHGFATPDLLACRRAAEQLVPLIGGGIVGETSSFEPFASAGCARRAWTAADTR